MTPTEAPISTLTRCMCGKVAYAAEATAWWHRRRLTKRNVLLGRVRPGMRLTVYRCQFSQSFHVGHTRIEEFTS